MKKIGRIFRSVLVLIAAALFFAATQDANAQTSEQKVTVVVQPAQSVEERVADAIKERELLKAAEEKKAAEESARLARTNPKQLLAGARTMHITSGTSFFESVQLQNALRKRTEFEAWQLMILDGTWDRRNVADLLIEVDRPLFTYTFTYQLTHPSTGIVLATGKVTAFDGNAAAPKLAKKIVEEIKKARGEATEKK
jgi:basic membrane lipoprotein Med (substrate-binding protein (PBP1-ABC) superfamily)